ncbi:primosomal protein N' [bacterium]|nr:primosomal protein N' [bacterium]
MSVSNQPNQEMIVQVAVNIPYSDPYDYLVPEEFRKDAHLGSRVLVSVRSRYVVGVITGFLNTTQNSQLKPILSVIESKPLFNEQMLIFTRWIADYYLCSWGEALETSIPASIKPKVRLKAEINLKKISKQEISKDHLIILSSIDGKSIKDFQRKNQTVSKNQIDQWRKSGVLLLRPEILPGVSGAETETWFSLGGVQNHPYTPRKGSKAEQVLSRLTQEKCVSLTELKSSIKGVLPIIRSLESQNLVVKKNLAVNSIDDWESDRQESFITLNSEQNPVFDRIKAGIFDRKYKTFLLHGITGSGKTEIYLYAVRETLRIGKTALILIPEISLTPQAVSRFRSRFGNRIAVMHSGLSEKQRGTEWWKIKNGECDIVIGARSAIFAPLVNIGLIVVDEEHDNSYKQQETPFYNSRDAAVKMAAELQAIVILGSATPSIESYNNTSTGKYELLELTQRANQKPLPETRVINLKDETRQPGAFYLSKVLIAKIREQVETGKQALIFLNRRGFASFLSCKACEIPVLCRNCSIAMTWHKTKRQLVCHHCGFTSGYPGSCTACGEKSFKMEGIGTQRVEQDLKQLIPSARFLRMDRDSIQKKGALEKHIDSINDRKVDVIVGTQLISKGHDFKHIGLVCVVLADMSLNIPDFRSSERSYQLISQVSGRAGRDEEGKGVTLIQTYNPQHNAIQSAINNDYSSFFKQEIEAREILMNPPFVRMILLKISSTNPNHAKTGSFHLGEFLKQYENRDTFQMLGPIESPIQKVNNRYYFQILLKGRSLAKIKGIIKAMLWAREIQRLIGSNRISLDVDPYMML